MKTNNLKEEETKKKKKKKKKKKNIFAIMLYTSAVISTPAPRSNKDQSCTGAKKNTHNLIKVRHIDE